MKARVGFRYLQRPMGDWQDRANCRDVGAELFFPEQGQDATAAKLVCAGCVVRADCLEHALAAHESYGVWGGTTEDEREKIRRARRRGAGVA